MSDKPAGLCEVQLNFLTQMPLLQQVLGSTPLSAPSLRSSLQAAVLTSQSSPSDEGAKATSSCYFQNKIGCATLLLFRSAQIIPQILSVDQKPDPAGARMDPSIDSCNAQVVLIHVFM